MQQKKYLSKTEDWIVLLDITVYVQNNPWTVQTDYEYVKNVMPCEIKKVPNSQINPDEPDFFCIVLVPLQV